MGTVGDGGEEAHGPEGEREETAALARPATTLGKRLLIVEDEFVIALDLQHLLEAAGHEVAGLAANVADALELAASAVVDGAILDINLRGERVGAVADLLARRAVPFVFVSGYGSSGRPPGHDHVPVLAKPYNEAELLAIVARF